MTTRLVAIVLLAFATLPAGAQQLPVKRTLSVGLAPGCAANNSNRAPATRRDNAEARRLAAAAQEAALVGDRAGARDAFAKAAALNPTDERLAYDLARSHQELGETEQAIREYCRYLALAPEGSDAGDVRARLASLASPGAVQASQRALDRFNVGVNNYDRARFDIAWQAFDDAVRAVPSAPEAIYNRALSRAAINRREEAVRDFEAYLAADPAAPDRLQVLRTIEMLRRPVYDPGTALRLGMLPGFGQFYTRRAASGIMVIAGVAGATAAALYERTGVRQVPYVDPNGVPAPYDEEFTERPYLVPAVAAAAAITLGAAIEAWLFARETKQKPPIEQPRGVRTGLSLGDRDLYLAPYVGTRTNVGLSLSARF